MGGGLFRVDVSEVRIAYVYESICSGDGQISNVASGFVPWPLAPLRDPIRVSYVLKEEGGLSFQRDICR